MNGSPLARLRCGPATLAGALLALLAPAYRAAQVLPSPLAPSNPAPVVYCPPERLSAGPPSAQHVLNVFLPRGSVPSTGWPVVVSTGYGGGSASPPLGSLASGGASAPLWNLVAAGIAVVHFGTPGLSATRGLWYPPGHPSGRYESFRPAHDNPEKSAEWALQWVKVQSQYPFDLARIGLRGSSGGAVLAIRTAMGPERARASGSAQVRASTRVAAILALQPPTSAWALEQGPELTIAFPKHLEQSARPGVPATQLSQVNPALQKDYSLMREAFASAAARANNASQAICLVYGDPVLRVGGAVATMALDAGGFPVLFDAIIQPQQHDSWFGYVFWRRLIGLSPEAASFHAGNSVFAMRDVNALAPPLDSHTRTYSGTFTGPAATRIGHEWLVARLRGPLLRAGQSADPEKFPARACRPQPELVLLRRLAGPGGRVVLGLRGPAGAAALVAVARQALGPECGVETGAGALRLDLGTLVGPPWVVLLAPDAEGFSEGFSMVELALGDTHAGDERLHLQALLLEPRRGARPRARLTSALELTR